MSAVPTPTRKRSRVTAQLDDAAVATSVTPIDAPAPAATSPATKPALAAPPDWRCLGCGVTKPASAYTPEKKNARGHYARCKPCRRLQMKASAALKLPESRPLTKTCTQCGLVKSTQAFTVVANGTLTPDCRICQGQRSAERARTVKGALVALLGNARASAKQRATRGRADAAVCTLTHEELRGLYEDQKGRCDFFGSKVMSSVPHTSWKMSLDRKDPALGYTVANCALVCREFNGMLTWSHAKVQAMLRILRAPSFVDVEALLGALQRPHRRSLRHESWHSEARTKRKACCDCLKADAAAKFASPREFMSSALTRMRNVKRNRGPAHVTPCTMLFSDIVDIVRQQEGRCAYSNLPLSFARNTDWRASPERVDPKIGYVCGNVALICLEFNTSCNQTRNVQAPPPVGDIGGQWSPAKFAEWIAYLDVAYPAAPVSAPPALVSAPQRAPVVALAVAAEVEALREVAGAPRSTSEAARSLSKVAARPPASTLAVPKAPGHDMPAPSTASAAAPASAPVLKDAAVAAHRKVKRAKPVP